MFYNCLFILLRVSLKITPYFAKHRVTKMVFQERNCIPFTQKIITAGISRQDDYEDGNAFRCLRIAIIYPTLAILVFKKFVYLLDNQIRFYCPWTFWHNNKEWSPYLNFNNFCSDKQSNFDNQRGSLTDRIQSAQSPATLYNWRIQSKH